MYWKAFPLYGAKKNNDLPINLRETVSYKEYRMYFG